MATTTTLRPFLLTRSRRAAMSLFVLWSVLVLLQLVGSHSEGIQWFPYLFIGWGTVLAVWYAVTLVLLYRHPELHQAIRLMVAERRAPSSPQ